jgi:hypothetical protein
MSWTDILGNVASGGLLGLLGTAVTFGLNYFKAKQEHAQRIEFARLEGELNAARTAGEVAVARERGAADAFTQSLRAEANMGKSYPWVSAVRELTRPCLTFFLMIMAFVFFFYKGELNATQAYIAQNIVVTAVAAVTWWFGQRQLDRSTVSWGNRTAGASVSSGATK